MGAELTPDSKIVFSLSLSSMFILTTSARMFTVKYNFGLPGHFPQRDLGWHKVTLGKIKRQLGKKDFPQL